MELVQLSAAQVAVLGAVIVGATEFISRLRAKDMWVAATIATSAILGGLIGLYYGTDFLAGATIGLGASGAIKTLSAFGNKSTPTESSVLAK